jgi:hypothetical protein
MRRAATLQWGRRGGNAMKRGWSGILALVIVGLIMLTNAASAQSMNLIRNGSFEEGFVQGVGVGWTSFDNGGNIVYGFRPDDWAPAVFDGQFSQLINLHTMSLGESQENRYAGIYQVVAVAPNTPYMFSLYGLVRSTEGTEQQSSYNYRVEVGFDFNGGTDPWAVTNWIEMDRWHEYPMDQPGRFDSFARAMTTTSNRLTVFIRVWKKFPTVGEAAVVNLDAINLLGMAPSTVAPAVPVDRPMLPATGVSNVLPFLGLGLGLLGVGLTGVRLLRARR